MPNVLTLPTSGIIQFNKQTFPNLTQQPLSASVQLEGTTEGGLRVYSVASAASAVDRFFVDGKDGRLFTVSDVLTGTLFSANDVSGLPILEVKDTDTVVMGEFNTNTLVVSGRRVGIGNNPFTSSVLSVSGNLAVGNATNTAVYTGETSTQPMSATTTFIKVIVNGVDRYLPLYALSAT